MTEVEKMRSSQLADMSARIGQKFIPQPRVP